MANGTIAERIDKLPEIVASGVVKALRHRSDRRPPGMGSKKPILVDAVLGEQRRQTLAVIRLDSVAKAGQQLGKRTGRWFKGIRQLVRLTARSGIRKPAGRSQRHPRRRR